MDKPTGARPIVIDGVTFRCFHTGVLRYEWRADGPTKIKVRQNHNHKTYSAWVDTFCVGSRFRSVEAAMRGAMKTAAA
jgi:hypothetical protein